ncbi:MAG: TIGR03960 family B12-binding radical SAM protein [Desulfobacteraceae bacterium]|nr:TIGR03960 family B12-binding radical SAM protein [Desulfobacteraceae bacterium]
MPKPAIQDILAKVERPSRYLGTEPHRVLKSPDRVALHMALAFPDLYEIGTSHFGIQILYHQLNERSDIYVERVFAPAKDLEAAMRQQDQPLTSLETRTPLNQFHIIGFSLLYELNYTNVLNMLNLAGIALYADQRTEADPIVIAGGPCVANPEPMAPFFDAMLFGDGETALLQMAEAWIAWKKEGQGRRRRELLDRWSRIQGVYIPSFFTATYDDGGFQHLHPQNPKYSAVSRAIIPELESAFFPERPVIAFGKPVHDRLRLEISRGCTRGCRFCQAGMIYRPTRERSPQRLLEMASSALSATGYEDVSLLSLSTGDYTCLAALMEALMARCHSQRVAVSLPSIRAGTLTPDLMALIKKVRKTGFTIAPEAGSQRLRDVINKNLSYEEIAATVQDAFAMGWQVIKLYYMIGLPTETQADLEAIVEMVQALKQIKGPARRRGQINVSATTFIPKAHTPFQWESQLSLEESWSKIEYLKSKLRIPGVQFKWQNPNMSLLEGVLARGDRRLAQVIETAWRSGCTFDGWSDQLLFPHWQQAFEACSISMDFFTIRQRSVDEPLPWEHMDARLTPGFLKSQREAAIQVQTLEDCRLGKCHQCGVCDFKQVQPQRFPQGPPPGASTTATEEQEAFQSMQLYYTKMGAARFFGHLEVATIFARALRRAQIPVQYSQGFHPMPRVSFDDPIPLGMESQGERLQLKVAPHISCQALTEALNAQLPEGIVVGECQPVLPGSKRQRIFLDQYRVELNTTEIDLGCLERFQAADQWPYIRPSRKGLCREVDLKQCVVALEAPDAHTLQLSIERKTPFTLRPGEILRSIFNIPESALPTIRVVKLSPQGYVEET